MYAIIHWSPSFTLLIVVELRNPETDIRTLQLALATLGTTGGLIWLSMRGRKATKEQGPPINASDPAEEAFIKYGIVVISDGGGLC